MTNFRTLTAALILASAGCYSSVPTDDGRICNFTYRDDARGNPATCEVTEDTTQSCYDAALCICEAWSPDATAAEIEACAESETMPRGAITLADFCGEHADLTLGEALRGYAETYDGNVYTDDGCEDIPATLLGY